MELTATQTLAAWIVFAQRTGKDGPIFPPRKTLEEIVKQQPDRFEEAEAMAKHFLEKVQTAVPTNSSDTIASGVRFVQGLDKMLGGVMGTPPIKAIVRGK